MVLLKYLSLKRKAIDKGGNGKSAMVRTSVAIEFIIGINKMSEALSIG